MAHLMLGSAEYGNLDFLYTEASVRVYLTLTPGAAEGSVLFVGRAIECRPYGPKFG